MQHADGIYFAMPDEEYFADAALGSTDLKRLLASGPDYYWHSRMNPLRPKDTSTPARLFGRAVHKIVLEGRPAFEALYVRRPDDLARLTAKERAVLAPNGQDVLDGEDYDRILVAGQLITKNPDLVTAFTGGMPEVSIFWTVTGEDGFKVQLKARFDYLKARGIGDLKSIRNTRGIEFPSACRRAISDWRYDVQAASYLNGRAQFTRLASEGRVFGDHDPAFLSAVVGCIEFGFQFVFFQATDAPITWSTSLSPGNPILEHAAADIDRALLVYRRFMERFGPDAMWVLQEPVEELDVSAMPAWFGRAA